MNYLLEFLVWVLLGVFLAHLAQIKGVEMDYPELLIFLVWFIIGVFIGTFLAKRQQRPGWTVVQHTLWWWEFIKGKDR